MLEGLFLERKKHMGVFFYCWQSFLHLADEKLPIPSAILASHPEKPD